MKNIKSLLFGIATIAWPAIIPAVTMLIRHFYPQFAHATFAGVTIGWFSFTALFIYVTFHAMKNPALPSAKKSRWMMYLLFCNIVAVPVYWYHYIWRADQNVSS
jgi:hypothetical protein